MKADSQKGMEIWEWRFNKSRSNFVPDRGLPTMKIGPSNMA
jgi:hypothetical protein